ncbi:MAG: hypothetical protein ACHQ0J_14345 [Candidatus Dormibacterales bacterium]
MLRDERHLQRLFAALLLGRLLYPFFNSPLNHLFSDPARHWENAQRFLHPSIMGSNDPFAYQLWLYLLQRLAHDSAPTVQLGCGLLCAAMPYGWYRALRELRPRAAALGGALVIGLIPESISIYAYFMTETLLLTLLGFCFWLTLRSLRKHTLAAYALACALWVCAAFTRTIAAPMALGCVALLWATQPPRSTKALVALALACALAIPAGLHARVNLGFFAPVGNLYFNEIYRTSGMRDIAVNYGPQGQFRFGSPSFYNPTFYPFSDWMTDRTGTVAFNIDLAHGRADWIAESARAAAERTFSVWRQRREDLLYLLFGQSWPDSDQATYSGWLTLWTRWLWAPLVAFVAWAAIARRYRGREWLLPVCALGTLVLLTLQTEGVMEARFRKPVDAILVAAALLVGGRRQPVGAATGALS